MFLPPVIKATTSMLAHFVAIEPLFRTTGHYRDRLTEMRGELTNFAGNMLNCLQWTRDYDPFSDKYYRPMAYGWPVGAVDICSGAAAFNPNWNEGVLSVPSPPAKQDPGGRDVPLPQEEPPIVTNVQESLERASEQRAQDFMAVFLQSGIPELLIYIAYIDEQIRVPKTSETVRMDVRKLGARKRVGTAKRTVEASAVCEARDFTADVYHFPRELIVSTTKQPLFYADFYRIPYHYYLESYSGDGPTLDPKLALTRKELTQLSGSLELKASCFDWEVEELKISRTVMGTAGLSSSSGLRQLAQSALDPTSPTRRYPGLVDAKALSDWEKMQWGDDPDKPGMATHRRLGSINIDYDIESGDRDDRITIRLRNHPEDGSFEHLYLVVEEIPGPEKTNLPPIRTSLDVSMIGLEYHLPSEYFQYCRDCLNKAAALLEKIRHLAQVSQVPLPRWDPWQYQSISDYVKAVQQEHPEMLKGIVGLREFR